MQDHPLSYTSSLSMDLTVQEKLFFRKHCGSKIILLTRFSLSTKHSKARNHLKVFVNK